MTERLRDEVMKRRSDEVTERLNKVQNPEQGNQNIDHRT